MRVELIRRGNRLFLDSASQTFAWHLSALIRSRGVAFVDCYDSIAKRHAALIANCEVRLDSPLYMVFGSTPQ